MTDSKYTPYDKIIYEMKKAKKYYSEIAYELQLQGCVNPSVKGISSYIYKVHPDLLGHAIKEKEEAPKEVEGLCDSRCAKCKYSCRLTGYADYGATACYYAVYKNELRGCEAGKNCTKFEKQVGRRRRNL